MLQTRSFPKDPSYRFLLQFFIPFAAFILIYFISLPNANSDQVTLAWDPNTASDIAGYKLYYGNSSGNYQVVIDVGNNTTWTISNLQEGSSYYFAVTDYDTSGNESGYSNEVAYDAPLACTYSISPTAQSFNSSGGSGMVNLTCQTGCSWTAVSNAPWIIITSNSSGTGNGTVRYSVLTNSGSTSQTGTVTIAGQILTVNQSSAASCSYTISPAGKSFNFNGGTGTISVICQTGCSWTASSNVSWITITSGSTGNGNGKVTFSVSSNSGTSSRRGTLTVAGRTFKVTQSRRWHR